MYSEYIIDEQATIEGVVIEEVYNTCISWLTTKKARIREQRRPEFIEAEHGHGRGITYQDHAKFFIIKLIQQGDNTIIDFKIPPLNWAPPEKSPVYHMYWTEFVEDLWRYVGITIDDILLRRLYPTQNLKKMISRNTLHFIILSIIFGVSGLFILLFTFWMKTTPFTIKILFMMLGIVSIVCWYRFARPLLLEAKKLRKRLFELY